MVFGGFRRYVRTVTLFFVPLETAFHNFAFPGVFSGVITPVRFVSVFNAHFFSFLFCFSIFSVMSTYNFSLIFIYCNTNIYCNTRLTSFYSIIYALFSLHKSVQSSVIPYKIRTCFCIFRLVSASDFCWRTIFLVRRKNLFLPIAAMLLHFRVTLSHIVCCFTHVISFADCS